MSVQTVTGVVEAADLGVTLPHEHLFVDTSEETRPPPPHIQAQLDALGLDLEQKPTLQTLGYLTRDPLWSARNQIVSEYDDLVGDLTLAAAAGIRTIVDATPANRGRKPAELPRLSEESGVQIVTGTGHYRAAFQPPGTADLSVEQLEEQMTTELTVGIDGTGVKAGLIGELGTSGATLHPVEARVLEAAGRVQSRLGVPIMVHTEGHIDIIMEALRILETAGANLEKVQIAHVAARHPTWRQIVATGARIGMDCFGFEYFKVDSRTRFFPTDEEFIGNLVRVRDEGFLDQVLVSNDVCHLSRLHKYGGWGFDHIQTNLVPYFLQAGFTDAELQRLFVEIPARWLDVS